ncbi:DegV family protein [candidate division FCPU426 bacterium]|nr:DegV family protein [candidate division FCPU426 bacterium]
MTEKIAVITDSTCDVPASLLAANGIWMAPLSVYFGEEEYQDGIDLAPEQFYQKLLHSHSFPTTSQPSPGYFMTLFQKCQSQGYTHVLCIHLSRKFSGTAQSAAVAAKMMPQLTIEVIDSKTCTWVLGGLALYAARLVRAGGDFTTVVRKVREQIPKTAAFFSADNLDYLARGGRIGKAKALLGKCLGIRPVMALRGSAGEIEVIEKTRSAEAASAAMVKLAAEHVKKYGICENMVALHAARTEYYDILMSEIKKAGVHFAGLSQGWIGGVIGAHLGPTGWALSIC